VSAGICTCFGLAVKALRESNGWSQERLAEAADLNRSYVGEIERGIVVPSLLTLQKLADALGMSSSALMADSERILQHRLARGIKLTAIAC
jgi:transcriptional regulator with XRE-family HTH domain